jgi:ketosteroid isomerase-like protein
VVGQKSSSAVVGFTSEAIDPPGTGPEDCGMSGDTRDVVEQLLSRMAEGDHARTAELFAEPVDWQLDWPSEGHPAVPWIRPRSSRADVADHFRSLEAHHVPELNGTSVTRVLVEGAHAVVLGMIVQTVRANGIAYTSPFALHLTVENGLVTRYHVYEDSLTVARALSTQA